MCQPVKLVGCENVPLFCIRRDEPVLSLTSVGFVKVSFSELNAFLIT